jgi:hypothetical protein
LSFKYRLLNALYMRSVRGAMRRAACLLRRAAFAGDIRSPGL